MVGEALRVVGCRELRFLVLFSIYEVFNGLDEGLKTHRLGLGLGDVRMTYVLLSGGRVGRCRRPILFINISIFSFFFNLM